MGDPTTGRFPYWERRSLPMEMTEVGLPCPRTIPPLEGMGSFYEHAKGRLVLYIPADLRKESRFPFSPGEKVMVRIKGSTLVVEGAP